MRIQNISQIQKAYGASQIHPVTKSKAKEKDAVTVSDVAKEYQLAYQSAHKVDAAREQRVADLKAKVQSGQYNVSAKEVSERIISQLDLKG